MCCTLGLVRLLSSHARLTTAAYIWARRLVKLSSAGTLSCKRRVLHPHNIKRTRVSLYHASSMVSCPESRDCSVRLHLRKKVR